jgi:hypothetical protein
VEVGPSPFKIGLHCQMLLSKSPQPTLTRDQYHPRLCSLFRGLVQQLVAPQSKVVLNVNHISQPFLFQSVLLLGVYTLENTPIAFTPRSIACLAQYPNCKLLQIRSLAMKLSPPIGCNKS